MAVALPAMPALRPNVPIFEESRKKFRSQVDRMWQEMQAEILNHKPLTFGASRTKTTEQSKQTAATPSVERTKESTEVAQQDKSSKPLVVANDGSFQLNLPLSSFKPEELMVKVVGDSLLVEAHHEEKDEKSGSSSRRHFEQRFLLPKSCDKDQVSSSLSAEGVLTICAPSKAIAAAPSEKRIQIESADKKSSN